VVDDEQAMAETLAELLENDGHETKAVYDGQAALEAARTFDDSRIAAARICQKRRATHPTARR